MREYTTEAIDQRLALLSKYERRCIIYLLQKSETDRVSISDVVNHLQKQDSTTDEHDRLEVDLRHNHLPQLDTVGAVDYARDSETVRYDGDELVEALLESTPDTHIPSN